MGRRIGSEDVGDLGLGCMGFSWAYGTDDVPEQQKRAVLEYALDRGIRLLDTSDFYGPHTNEELLGTVVPARRDEVFVSTKGGLVPDDHAFMRTDGRPEHVAAACDASLRRLGIDHLDLYQLHRVDPAVPLGETWSAMSDLVSAGKVRHLGLCEVTVAQCDVAAAIHPVSSVQGELSVWERGPLADVVPWCVAHDATFVAFSPLGRGFLTGSITAATEFRDGDFRSRLPRFTAEAVEQNRRIVTVVEDVAARYAATAAQVALAWLLSLGSAVLPIPGTTKRHRIEENLKARTLRLQQQDLDKLTSLEPASQPRY